MLKLRLLSVNLENTTFENLEESLYTLPSTLQDKVNSLRNPIDRLMSLCTRLLVRQAISEDLNLPLDGVVLQYGEYGKPYVSTHEDYHFSVSHCDGMVAFVSHDSPIGVDVESIKHRDRNLKLERKLFTQSEVAYIENSTTPDTNFFQVWTRKESYTKMLGLGLHKPFSSFDTTLLHQQGYFSTHIVDGYMVTICAKDVSLSTAKIFKSYI